MSLLFADHNHGSSHHAKLAATADKLALDSLVAQGLCRTPPTMARTVFCRYTVNAVSGMLRVPVLPAVIGTWILLTNVATPSFGHAHQQECRCVTSLFGSQ